jgi:2-oxoisovalerate dehydrogenase E1 component alpha subunit
MIGNLPRLEAFTSAPIRLLDEDGRWTASFENTIGQETLLALYRDMVRARRLDERFSTLQRQGKVSFVASAAGHEAAQVGAAHALQAGRDWVFPYYRDLPLLLGLGWSVQDALAQSMATRLDPAKGRQMPAHPGSLELRAFTPASAIASHIPPAVGSAMAQKLSGKGDVTLCSFGDGATSEGDWHAAMNLAGVRGAPVVFLCQNNGYAISVDFQHQSGSPDVSSKAHAYGMPAYRVDGMDVLAVYHAVALAVQQARDGVGPSLVEAFVYRYGPHSNADDDTLYRSADEVAAWRARDPLPRYRRYLEARGLWSEQDERALAASTREELDAAVKANEAAGAPPLAWMFDDVLAQRPLQLERQREAMAEHRSLEDA